MATMSTATSKAPRKPARPRPADTCRLTLTIRGVAYGARPVRPEDPGVIRAWTLRKTDGESYTVAETTDGSTCDCADFTFRHEGHDQVGCKHIRALGLIEPDADEGPESWPAWTDTHAFAVNRR